MGGEKPRGERIAMAEKTIQLEVKRQANPDAEAPPVWRQVSA